jgi:hypothetical protein
LVKNLEKKQIFKQASIKRTRTFFFPFLVGKKIQELFLDQSNIEDFYGTTPSTTPSHPPHAKPLT